MPRPRGLPKTGGRQKGTRNKVVKPRSAVGLRVRAGVDKAVEQALAENLTPLEWMLRVLRDPETEPHRRDQMAAMAAPYIHPRLAVADVRTVQATAPLEGQKSPEDFKAWAQQRIREVFGDTLPSMGAPITNPTPSNPPPRVIEHEPVEVDAADRSPADARDIEPVDEDELLPAEAAMRRRVVPLRGPRGEDAF
jgi:hypothetical protein